ncbi:UDP-N-acetylmuramoyl-tripeptide--D-alanyl-D-alanine ligase [Paenibacillus phyllosphaerae]|uniref:UDP-N-acetylmuramoyl-tripeptide--D-alanyl-D-alanine ligase n=1 Tax=Paenibacillus phyllosphaerae TaxID=274593 RepID=A0A7W5B2H6_9BACL|nr:UDP-N-acetylmuramoyl-tripeptide--D-alanyl-D-alanine ligase [Paenibacillus phyllosphaerae]MBB3113220.1 UDP-N-acetylmuramoyl-tripeptide--D-alanyl-D-alanine ligase [Paenibacillus phyllosphaerae]
MTTILHIIAVVAWLLYAQKKLLRSVHMLQLNSYRNERFWKWYKGNIGKTVRIAEILPLIGLILVIAGSEVWGSLAWMASYFILFMTAPKEIEKKKLVYTARVKRLLTATAVLAIVIGLSLLLQLELGYALMFAATIVPFFVILISNTVMLPVEHRISLYYLNDAKKKIHQYRQLEVIGITGSFGKTSVKHFLGTVLSQGFNVLITPESYNTPMGVTRTVRSMLTPTHEYFVSEMGAKQRGDIKEICDLVSPKYGIITAIGEQHLETFKTLDTIKKTKFELAEALPADGIAFLNIDDENVAAQLKVANIKARVATYGIHSAQLDYRASDIRYTRDGTFFKVTKKSTGEEQEFQTVLLGEHNVYNLLVSIAVGSELGVPLTKLATYVRKVRPVKHRLELKKNGPVTILDDSFNSNPVGSKAALTVLSQMEGKKILITPGMIELGDKEYELNFAFGTKAAEVCDYVLLVGQSQTKPLQDAFVKAGYPESKYKVTKNLKEALQHMNQVTEPGCIVLLENDLPDNYNE